MQSLLFSALLMIGAHASAEATKIEIHGMHCGGCKANVQREVCKKGEYAKCEATLDNPDQQIGFLTIEPKKGKTVDTAKVFAQIKEAGYEPVNGTAPATPAAPETPAKKK